jgi:hypothetical protein
MRMRTVLGVGTVFVAAGLAGCQADYGADLRNTTPQPVYAQLLVRGGGGQSVVTQKRLGPGDRGYLGPVRASNKPGRVALVVDSMPNPVRPATMDLPPGTTFVDVTQDGDRTAGAIRLSPKPE